MHRGKRGEGAVLPKSIVVFVAIFLLCFTETFAAEFGATVAPMSFYVDEIELLFTGQTVRPEQSGIPVRIYLWTDHLRISFLHYEFIGFDRLNRSGVTGDGSFDLSSDLLLLSIPFQFEIPEMNGLFAFATAGIGTVKTRANLEVSGASGAAFASVSANVRSKGSFNPAFEITLGFKKLFDDHYFIGGEGSFISASNDLESANGVSVSVDQRVLLASVLYGVRY
jgi:hypothetical protein